MTLSIVYFLFGNSKISKSTASLRKALHYYTAKVECQDVLINPGCRHQSDKANGLLGLHSVPLFRLFALITHFQCSDYMGFSETVEGMKIGSLNDAYTE